MIEHTDILSTLDRYIRARYPIIATLSHEENRVMAGLKSLATTRKRRLAVWSITTGLDLPGADVETTQNLIPALEIMLEHDPEDATIFVFRDMHPYISDPIVTRYLRDVAARFETTKHNLIMLSPSLTIPPDLEKSILLLDWPLPGPEDLQRILARCINDLPQEIVSLNGSTDDLIRAMSGLTEFEATNALSSAVIATGELSENAIPYIVKEKRQTIRKAGVLEYYEADTSMSQVGGLKYLKQYAEVKLSVFSKEAEDFGLDAPKGVLMIGIPGTGKSLAVKAIAADRMPLLRLDIGAVMGKLVGQSEENLRTALKVAEAVAPCVLWLDEIEKALSSNGDSDGGTSMRVFGTLLTWMQEKKAPVYIVATANDARNLQPELLRRFDDLFWVDLPCKQDRIDVLSVHLSKRHQDPSSFSLDAVSDATWGFTGAEIEKVVKSGMENAFFDNRTFDTSYLLAAAEKISPICDTMSEKINALRSWAKGNTLIASEMIEQKPEQKRKTGGRLELD